MNRRGGEGPMDGLEFSNPQFDASSPFAQISQRTEISALQSSASAFGDNPFAKLGTTKSNSALRDQSFPHPPGRSIFSPSLSRNHTAPALRNPAFTSVEPNTPAFTTPQKDRFDDVVMSERSFVDVEESPAMTDVSFPSHSPDFDDSGILDDDMDIPTLDPTRCTLFLEKKSGKGELPRPRWDWLERGKVRKRKRIDKDRDIGSTRLRSPDGRDEDDGDYDEPQHRGHSGRRLKQDTGWLGRIMSSISSNPNAPIALSRYLQVSMNAVFAGAVLWMVWGVVSGVRGEVRYTLEKARAEKLAEVAECADHYLVNKCSPKKDRLPALDAACNGWGTCMNQDPNSVAGVKASAAHVADILNEFFSRLDVKTYFAVLLIVVVVFWVGNISMIKTRRDMGQPLDQPHARPAITQPALGPIFSMPPQRNQAYIFAPLNQTSRHIKRAFLAEDTDSEVSPDPRWLPPPKTTSGRKTSQDEISRGLSQGSPNKRID